MKGDSTRTHGAAKSGPQRLDELDLSRAISLLPLVLKGKFRTNTAGRIGSPERTGYRAQKQIWGLSVSIWIRI